MPSVTINFSVEHATRIQDALEHILRLEAPATVDDLKTKIIGDIRQFVRVSEKRKAHQLAETALVDVDIT